MKQTSFLPDPEEPPKAPDPQASASGRALAAKRWGAVKAGHERADKAGAGAERQDPGWLARACELTLEYGRLQPGGFLIEDAAANAYARGLPQPKEKRAWGSVVLRLKRGEPGQRVVACGFHTDSFGSPKTVWKVN